MKNIKVLFSIIFLLFIPSVSGITWSQQCQITVHVNDNITCAGVNISHTQFSSPVRGIKDINKNIVPEYTVIPSIVFDTNFEKQIILTNTYSSYIEQTNKSIRIDVSGFPNGNSNVWLIESYSPSAILTIYTRQLPQVSLSLTSDKTIYESVKDTNINITLSIKNTDTKQFESIRITFNQNSLDISKTFPTNRKDFTYCCLNPSQTFSYQYNLEVPNINHNSSYTVNATVELQDPEITNKYIDYNVGTSFNVVSQKREVHILFTKFIQDRLYTNDDVYVILGISNSGDYSLYGVQISDSNNNILYPLNSSQKLSWYIPEIKPNNDIELRYKVYPVISGAVTVSAAQMNYSFLGHNYQVFSNQISTTIINNTFIKLREPPISATPPIITSKQTAIPIQTPQNNTTISATKSTPIPTDTPIQIPGFEGVTLIISVIVLTLRRYHRNKEV